MCSARPALAQDIASSADLDRVAAGIPEQPWYPEDYYDIRVAAAAQVIEAELPLKNLTHRWDDQSPEVYDMVECGEGVDLGPDADPTFVNLSFLALQVSRIRDDLSRLGFPAESYEPDLLAYEKSELARIQEPDANSDASNFKSQDSLRALGEAIEARREGLGLDLPKVIVEFGCGAGGLAGIVIKTVPPSGEVWLINAFRFKVCTRRQRDPWDHFACPWNELETGKETDLSGRYVYDVLWPDGKQRHGTREITPSDTPTVVTFRKSGS